MVETNASRSSQVPWGLFAILLLGAGALGYYLWSHGTRPLDGLTSSKVETRQAAAEALARVEAEAAPEAVAALTRALDDVDPLVRGAAARSLGSNLAVHRDLANATGAFEGLERVLKDKSKEVRASAALALALAGRDSEPIFDGLLEGTQGKEPLLRGECDAALSTLDVSSPARLQRLFALAEEVEGPARKAALQALDQVKPHVKRPEVIALLAEKLRSADAVVSIKAANALKQGAPGEADAVPPLAEALSTAAPEVRRAAAEALAAFMSQAPAREALEKALEDEGPEVRGAAAFTLVQGPRPAREEVLAELKKALGDDTTAVPALIERLNDNAASVRVAVARALGEVAPRSSGSADAAIALGRALIDSETQVRIACCQALARFGKPARDLDGVVPALKKACEDQHKPASAYAMAALKLVDVPEQR